MLFVLLSGNTSALGEDSGDDTFEKMVGMENLAEDVDMDGGGITSQNGVETDRQFNNDGGQRPSHSTKSERERRTVSVDTPLGRVIGVTEKETHTFLGIPYAEPPLGPFRYRPPRQKKAWAPTSVKAFDFASECLQSSLYSDTLRKNSEDCLYLNVWTPKAVSFRHSNLEKDLLPVMFWVYGGAFLHGGAGKPEYIGSRLAKRGVIVVSCNYRLGALGFLVSTADGLYGNYGLADQKMAMMWVNENIRSFGGDPERVTVFGESAGAMSLGLHIFDQYQRQQRQRKLNLPEKSLFQAAILQSNPFGYSFRSVAVANFLGTEFKERLDCEDLRCLQSESGDELIHVQDTLMAVPRNIGDFFTWGPVVTDEHFWREFRLRPGDWANVTVRQPLNVMRGMSLSLGGSSRDSRVRGAALFDTAWDRGSSVVLEESQHNPNREYHPPLLPMIIGTTKDEGSVFVFTAYPTVMPKFIYQAVVVGFFRFAARRVLQKYSALSREQQLSPDPDYRLVLSVIIGDYLFKCPTQLFATLAQEANSSVFLYEFALPTRTPGYPCCDGLACHTSELPYVFNHLDIIREGYSYLDEEDVFEGEVYEADASGGVLENATEKKKSFFDVAKGFFGDKGVKQHQQHQQQQDHQKDLAATKKRPRHAVDTNVSDHMSDYWTTFASFLNPNGGGGDSVQGDATNLNVVVDKEKMPLWVTVTGVNRHRRERENNGEKSGKGEYVGEEEDSYRMHLQYASELERKMRLTINTVKKVFNHQLVFDEETAMHILGDDCHCSFWNSLGYKF